jgi:hypothetical protein
MSQTRCENLTSDIRNLQALLPRVDLALNTFKPEDGVLAKDEAMRIVEVYDLLHNLFKYDVYNYFVQVLDSKEELKRRIAIIETTGMTGYQLKKQLEGKKIEVFPNAERMLQSSKFAVVQKGEKIPVILLRVREIFADNKEHAYGEILDRAEELGLGFLPHETAVNLLFDEKNQPEKWAGKTVVSKPLPSMNANSALFSLGFNNNGTYLNYNLADYNTEWRPDSEFLFSVRKSKN